MSLVNIADSFCCHFLLLQYVQYTIKLPQLQRCKKNLITFESTFAMIFLLYSNQYSLIDSSFFLKKFSFSFMICTYFEHNLSVY